MCRKGSCLSHTRVITAIFTVLQIKICRGSFGTDIAGFIVIGHILKPTCRRCYLYGPLRLKRSITLRSNFASYEKDPRRMTGPVYRPVLKDKYEKERTSL